MNQESKVTPIPSLPPFPEINPKRHKPDPFHIPSRPSTATSRTSADTMVPAPSSAPLTAESGDQDGDNLLPAGWSKRTDLRTGMSYYENHWTLCTTWTDPRTLQPPLLSNHDWSHPAPGWDTLQDELGQSYWVHHDSQTSSWSGPRERRVRKLLDSLKERYLREESDMKSRRDRVQSLRGQILKLLASDASDEKVFTLNDSLELECKYIEQIKAKLEFFQTLMENTVDELTGVRNQAVKSSEIARGLHESYIESHSLFSSQHKLVLESNLAIDSIPPVHDMPIEKVQMLHLLPDHLTVKSSLEMCLELKLLEQYNELIKCQLNKLVERLESAGEAEEQFDKLEFRPIYLELIEAGFEELMDRFLLNS